jgi:hypothetical protein
MLPEPVNPVWLGALTSFAAATAPAAAAGLGAVAAVRAWRRTPALSAWSLGLGALAGLLLAAAAVAGGPLVPVLNPGDILASGSPWDIPGEALVRERFPAALAGLGEVVGSPLAALPRTVGWLVRAVILALAAAIVLPFLTLPPPPALATGLAALAVAGATTLAALYIVCFGPWLLNLLNFWALGLLLALFCYWRHGTL